MSICLLLIIYQRKNTVYLRIMGGSAPLRHGYRFLKSSNTYNKTKKRKTVSLCIMEGSAPLRMTMPDDALFVMSFLSKCPRPLLCVCVFVCVCVCVCACVFMSVNDKT